MTPASLALRSLTHYWRTNLAVVAGVMVAVSVLAGALLVGDSVRGSLREIAVSRLGQADHAVLAPGFFREALAEDLQVQPAFADVFIAAAPIIALEGFVTHQDSGRRAGRVLVYGVDERFWRFHGLDGRVLPLAINDVLVSPSLSAEFASTPGDALLVRVEKPSAIPLESLHGRRDDVGRTMRLTIRETLLPGSLGEFSLSPQQGAVRAVFVPLARLQRDLERPAQANVLLVAQQPGAAGVETLPALEAMLPRAVTPEDLGLGIRSVEPQGTLVVDSASGILSDAVAGAARAAAAGWPVREVLTYVANTIRVGDREIPYSVVTALDLEASGFEFRVSSPQAPESPGPASALAPIILNEWAARDVGARAGDEVDLEYYRWDDEGRLVTQEAVFRLAGIVPLAGAAADSTLTPDYPGITDSDTVSDWDPPFPIDLRRVRPADERYWEQYRATPKAFVPLEVGQALWGSRHGTLTSLRVRPPAGRALEEAAGMYRTRLAAALDPIALGFTALPVREQARAASEGATDFGEYFTYFSFFLVCSALLLAALFFKLGIEQRLKEIGLLRAVGFPPAAVRRIFLAEGAALAVLGSLLGGAGAIGYAWLIIHGLSTWWVGAVGTTLLRLHVSPVSLALGAAAGVLAALLVILASLRAIAPASARSLLAGTVTHRRAAGWARRPRVLAATVAGGSGVVLLAAAAAGVIGEAIAFFAAGALLLVASLFSLSAWLTGRPGGLLQGTGWWPLSRLGFRNASDRPGRSVLCVALIASAAFVIVAVEVFRRDGVATLDPASGTGGYALLAESLLPIVHDPNAPGARSELHLGPDSAGDPLAGIRFERLRLRPGDDASCLNLYRPANPRVLGVTPEFVRRGRFAFAGVLAATPEEAANPWLLLEREGDDGAVPVIADANSLRYVLHLGLGDEFVLRPDSASPVRLRVVAALADSIFQGEFLMAERHFIRLFPGHEGYRVFLLDLDPDALDRQDEVAALLEDRLSDFGFDASSTAERLAAFHRVENTYLSTFQTLGALGLLLGTFGLAAVMIRNVLERRRELALLRAVGYDSRRLSVVIVSETTLLLACGLAAGAVCALLAIAPAFAARGGQLGGGSVGLLLAAVALAGLASSLAATLVAARAPLLGSLRAE